METIISNNYRASNNILTIVYNHKSMITIWSLRMRIHFRWDTMSRPTSMCNTNMTMNLWVEVNISIYKEIINFNQFYLSLFSSMISHRTNKKTEFKKKVIKRSYKRIWIHRVWTIFTRNSILLNTFYNTYNILINWINMNAETFILDNFF